MKAARIVVLGVALVAGVGAAMLAGGSKDPQPPAPVVQAAPPMRTVDVLVAAKDIAVGGPVRTEDLRWQTWPEEAANAAFLNKTAAPNAIPDTVGSIARTPFAAGEPIRPEKLIKANGSGYMAAILPAGMRAISIEISAETGAGGFILPNDRVDVILSRRVSSTTGGADESVSETISRNVRVLAIDQTIADKDGEKVVVGKTATLELSPKQSEQIALSRSQGAISLALRSLVDSSPTADVEPPANDMMTVRYGVTSGKSQ